MALAQVSEWPAIGPGFSYRVPVAASSRRSPAKPGIAGIMMMTLNFLFSFAALKQASTIAAPIILCMGDWSSPVAVTVAVSGGPRNSSRKLTKELILYVHVMFCTSDDLTVRVLDTMLCQDPTTPVRTTPDQLRMHRSLVLQI